MKQKQKQVAWVLKVLNSAELTLSFSLAAAAACERHLSCRRLMHFCLFCCCCCCCFVRANKAAPYASALFAYCWASVAVAAAANVAPKLLFARLIYSHSHTHSVSIHLSQLSFSQCWSLERPNKVCVVVDELAEKERDFSSFLVCLCVCECASGCAPFMSLRWLKLRAKRSSLTHTHTTHAWQLSKRTHCVCVCVLSLCSSCGSFLWFCSSFFFCLACAKRATCAC